MFKDIMSFVEGFFMVVGACFTFLLFLSPLIIIAFAVISNGGE